jgi:small GTP-binding protein
MDIHSMETTPIRAAEPRKICLLGDFAVGKTSLVSRYVQNVFSDRYLTTVGVKIDTRVVELGGVIENSDQPARVIKLVLWDLAGAANLNAPARAYIQGAHGFLAVCDGTRRATLNAALALLHSAREQIGVRPAVLLVNKQDLYETWEVDQDSLDSARTRCANVLATSAKTGANVDRAFRLLAEQCA